MSSAPADLAAPAAADQVTLTNGDRISGTVVSLAGSTLTLSTPHGDLRIPWADVTGLVIEDAILVTVGDADPTEVRIAAADAAGRVDPQSGRAGGSRRDRGLARPMPPITVDGGVNAGFITTSGNTDVNNLRLDADVTVGSRPTATRPPPPSIARRIAATRPRKNWNLALNYDRFLTERLFLNANAIFTKDLFRDLDLRTALGVGVGYQVLNTQRVRLTANAGLGWVNEDFDAGVDDSYTAARESAALDIFIVPDRVQLFHQHDGYFGINGDDNLFVKMKNGVRLGLVARLVTTAQIDLDYDRSPVPGRRTRIARSR